MRLTATFFAAALFLLSPALWGDTDHRAPRIRPVADSDLGVSLDTVFDRGVIEGLILDLSRRSGGGAIFNESFSSRYRRDLSSLTPEARLEVMAAALDILHNQEQCTLKVKDLKDLQEHLSIILELLKEDFSALLSQLVQPVAWPPDGQLRPILDESLAVLAWDAVVGGYGHGGTDGHGTGHADRPEALPAVPAAGARVANPNGVGNAAPVAPVSLPGRPPTKGPPLGAVVVPGFEGGRLRPEGAVISPGGVLIPPSAGQVGAVGGGTDGFPVGVGPGGHLGGVGGYGGYDGGYGSFVPYEVTQALFAARDAGVLPPEVLTAFGNKAGNIADIQKELQLVEEQLRICKDVEKNKKNNKKNNKNKNNKDKKNKAKKAKSPKSESPPGSPPQAGGGQPPEPSKIPDMRNEPLDYSEWIAAISAGSGDLLAALLANPGDKNELIKLIGELLKRGMTPRTPKDRLNQELLAMVMAPPPITPLKPLGPPIPPPPGPPPDRSTQFRLRIQSIGADVMVRLRNPGSVTAGGRVPTGLPLEGLPGNAGSLNGLQTFTNPSGQSRTTFDPRSRGAKQGPPLRQLFPTRGYSPADDDDDDE